MFDSDVDQPTPGGLETVGDPSAHALSGTRNGSGRRADIRVGITIDTRPDWNGPDNFLRAMDEAAELGYRWIEVFPRDMGSWFYDPPGFKAELEKRNLGLITVSGHSGQNFTDPRQRGVTVDSMMEVVRFIHYFGCDHLKTNLSGEIPRGEASHPPEVYREMAITINEIGNRMADFGMKFGIHAHLNATFETRQDIDAIMDRTNPETVYFILDTGHITMAGMDPVQLTSDYADRIVEYHLKDVAPENRGGASHPMGRMIVPGAVAGQVSTSPEYPNVETTDLPASIRFRNRHFFELGRGGVDFPTILQLLNESDWAGWFTVELDSTTTTAKGSAAVTKEYLERVLMLET